MEITEEQRKRAESNRLAALEKRKAILESTTCLPIPEHPWRLSKCQKQSPELTTSFPKQQSLENTYIDPFLKPHLPEKFRARLEIYSPDSFSVTPEPAKGFLYLGETECLRKLRDYLLDVIPSDYTQNQSGGKAILYKLENYNAIWKCLKNTKGIELEEIPRRTLNVLQRLLHSYVSGQWIPCRPEHLSDEEVDKLIGEMPKTLFDALLPFQIDGLRFGLRRGGRCLIADEMGLGKTLQAIAIACCFMNEGSILVVCPAILRYSWAEELERWLPFCLPGDIHLVFSHQNNPSYLTRCPRVVVISYTMLHHLQKSMLEQDWAVLIVDESHHVRSTKKKSEPEEAEDRAHRRGQTKAVNIYIFCAKDSPDESHWQYLNKSLCRVSSTTDGRNAIQEIEVEDVSFIDMSNKTYGNDESWVLDTLGYNEVTAEQMKLSHTGLHQAIDNEVAEKNDKSEGNVSEVQIGSPRRVPSCRVDEDINERGQEADESCLSQVDSLRFEVSQYTGRIHLYSCIPGTDLRPRPLFENFRPEEIESLNPGGAISDKIRENPAYRQAILAFINEWNNLRSIEQKKLIGKPLQLPLTVELLCLSESNNHGSEGLLKWGSKRRHTPLNELSHPLPPDAVLRDISLCSGYGKKEKVYTQGWSLTNEPLCKYCQAPCESKNAKTPAYFEDLFCTFDCYEEYRMRTSDRFLRQELFQLEHGVCTNCKLDCHKLVEHLKPLSLPRRLEYIVKVAPKVAKRKNLLDKLINDPIEGNAWHADHIVPVYRGGGECKVENMRTLCVACHSDFTAAQCADRRSTRVEAKKKLKVIMSKLKNSQNLEGKHANSEGQGQLEMEENIVEDGFLIKVPGSAYSGGFNIGSRSHALEKSAKAQ